MPDLQTQIPKILIANRGEIAVRVLRTCRELGIGSVAVFSEADRGSLHVRLADESVCIGPAPAAESYLDGEKIIRVARDLGAPAVHPGYGFLSENAAFAQAVSEAGLAFIGPPPQAIRAMGDKARARSLMEKAGVPVVPGYQGADDPDSLAQAAGRIGYPVLVKAAAGGGGKGMRVVGSPQDIPEALAAARREAQNAFGDPRLILEKFIAAARHVEIQVLADHHGRCAHLNERECSVQRRYQKIIEEAPSPLLDADLRAEMGAAAVAAARAAGYTNAGTVEFIVDPETRAYYFLEMNTRLQVEHPITELTAGIDLVAAQIHIAAGASLDSLLPAHPEPRGHAIECRLYAEDPAVGFLPDSGTVLRFIPPQGPGVRVDAGIRSGDPVSTHYDPLLAKIIVHAADRPAAIRRMQAALRDTVLLGLRSNLDFLQDVLDHPAFLEGRADTSFIDRQFGRWKPDGQLPTAVMLAAALAGETQRTTPGRSNIEPYTPWTQLPGFRLGQPSEDG